MGVWLGSALWCWRGGGVLVLPGYLVPFHDLAVACRRALLLYRRWVVVSPLLEGGLQVHPHQWLYRCWTEVPCIVLLLVCGV